MGVCGGGGCQWCSRQDTVVTGNGPGCHVTLSTSLWPSPLDPRRHDSYDWRLLYGTGNSEEGLTSMGVAESEGPC